MAKPAPPKIAPKPGQVKVVRALYGYTAQQEDELSFNEGDVLYLTEQITNPDWWKARCGTKTGLIPSNYVELKADVVDNPVHDAARRGNIEFLRECLLNGVSPTGLDTSGNSPLHWSARGGHLDCVQEIVRSAVKQFQSTKHFISAQNKLGDTPLHYACNKSHLAIVTLLVEHGADPTVVNKDGETPLDLCHDPEIKTLLLSVNRSANDVVGDHDDYVDESDED